MDSIIYNFLRRFVVCAALLAWFGLSAWGSGAIKSFLALSEVREDPRYADVLLEPAAIARAANGNLLLLNGSAFDRSVFEFSGSSGVLLGRFANLGGAVLVPGGMAVAGNGDLYVVCIRRQTVVRIDGKTGRILDPNFIGSAEASGFSGPLDLVSVGDDRLLVSSHSSTEIAQFDANSGRYIGRFAQLPSDSGNRSGAVFGLPVRLASVGGRVYASDPRLGHVYAFDAATGRPLQKPVFTRKEGADAPLRAMVLCGLGEDRLIISDVGTQQFSILNLTDNLHEVTEPFEKDAVPTLMVDAGGAWLAVGAFISGTEPVPEMQDIYRFAAVSGDACLECEALAGHPADPGKAKGVPGAEDDALYDQDTFDKAFEACERALVECPTSPGVLFASGRLYFIAGAYAEAAVLLNKAAQLGHTAAYAYLAEMEEDEAAALRLYDLAIQGGFAPAFDMMAARLDRASGNNSEIDYSRFNFAPIMKAFCEQDVEFLNSLDFLPYFYITNLYAKMADVYVGCPTLLNPAIQKPLTLQIIPKALDWLNGGGLNKVLEDASDRINNGGALGGMMWAIDVSMDWDIFQQQAMQDAHIFIEEFGCHGEMPDKLKKGINKFFYQ